MERFELAAAAIREAGAALRQSRLRSGDIEIKTSYQDLVTYWDRKTEQLLRGRILSAFPGDAIVGEEYPPSNGDERGVVWYIDPIDGTTNFINQSSNYAISVGCWAGDEPLFGLVLDVERDALYSARPGAGAWLEGRPLHVTSRTSLCEMLLTTPGVQYSFLEPHPWQERLVKLARAVRGVRCLGSVALELCELAAGKADLFVTMRSSPWDHNAARIIVTEAGGLVRDITGAELPLGVKSTVLAVNSQRALEEIRRLLG